MANAVQPPLGRMSSSDAWTDTTISVSRIMRTGTHLYLLHLLRTNENKSNFNTLCIFLCLCSLLIEICGFYFSICGRLSKKLSFVTVKLSFLNLWLVILAMIHMKLRDSFENNVMGVIFGACFVLSTMYTIYTYVHVFERETKYTYVHDSRNHFVGAAVGDRDDEDDKKEHINEPFLVNYGQIISIEHAYLVLCFLDEKESTFQILGIFVCLSSALIEFNEFFNFFYAKDRVSVLILSFAAHVVFLVNVWVAVLILMHIKLPDFFIYIAFGIVAPCFILSAIFIKSETYISDSDSASLQNGDIHEEAATLFTVLTFVHAYYIVRFMGEKASNLRTLGIFLSLTFGFVELFSLFYSLWRLKPDGVAKKKKLLSLMQICYFVHCGVAAMQIVSNQDCEDFRIATVVHWGIIAIGMYSVFLQMKKDPFSYFKRLCNVRDNSKYRID